MDAFDPLIPAISAMGYNEMILDVQINIKRKARGFCLNEECEENGDLYKIKIRNNHYRKSYSTDNKNINFCPSCRFAIFWTKEWVSIEGYKTKEFKYKERPTLCP